MSAETTWPRRAQMQQWVPAEKAIYDAVQLVEGMGASVRLTDAVVLLGKAREAVADFVDQIKVIDPGIEREGAGRFIDPVLNRIAIERASLESNAKSDSAKITPAYRKRELFDELYQQLSIARRIVEELDHTPSRNLNDDPPSHPPPLDYPPSCIICGHAKKFKISYCPVPHQPPVTGVCYDCVDARRTRSEAPPPRADDIQVSPENGPDYDARYFRDGITSITHKGGVLIFEFATGGKIHVSNPVIYVMPEKH